MIDKSHDTPHDPSHDLMIVVLFQNQGGGAPMVDTIQRHEVDKVINNQNDIIYTAREIK